MTPGEVYEFWQRQAQQHGDSHAASWSDRYVIEMEVRALTCWLQDDQRVLDVGCANGFSTFRLATNRRLSIRGIDYAPEMIHVARARLSDVGSPAGSDVEFAVGDALNLTEPSDTYDCVVVVRVIINLGSWERQQAGLLACLRTLRPGGQLLLSEAWLDGWHALNRLRAEVGLEPIPMPPFNNYLDRSAVISALDPDARLVAVEDFASSYYVGSRVVKPLLARLPSAAIDVANPESELNRFFAQVPPAGDYGTQKLLVFEKR
jgi:SAM-dependent methyltransferase